MKKRYEAPRAERLEFNYQENIVASLVGNGPGLANEHANINSTNHCYTQNTSNVVTNGTCEENAKPKENGHGHGHGHGH